jgi:cob(I)alamin adenosyltransferase
MGNRLSKLVTKTGDKGTTGISGNIRVNKDCHRIEAIGTVDELNACIGMTLSQPIQQPIAETLNEIQQILFNLGGELAMPDYSLVTDEHVTQIETWVDDFNESLPPLKEFILPKGSLATTSCHLARTVCRRAERRLVTLAREEDISTNLPIYLNRLSDLLFVFCRMIAKDDNHEEIMWKSKRTEANPK